MAEEMRVLILRTNEHGLSQGRERVFMLGVREDVKQDSVFFYEAPAALDQALSCSRAENF